MAAWWESASQARTAALIRRSPSGTREILISATKTLRDSPEVDPRFPLAFLALWQAGAILSRPERRA